VKNDGVAPHAVFVGSRLFGVTSTGEYAEETDGAAFAKGLKEIEVLSVCQMIPNGFVATIESHVAELAFAKKSKDSVRIPAVIVSVVSATLTAEEENGRNVEGGANASLLLSPEGNVDVPASVVCLTDHKLIVQSGFETNFKTTLF
jgi:hypothetical protein